MSTTITYNYDKSHRLTSQVSSTGETHAFSYNQRDMVTQITDSSPGTDPTRTFTYNGLGERVTAVDGLTAHTPTYYTYDGNKILTEKDAVGNVTGRYRQGSAPVPGSALEVVTSLEGGSVNTYNMAFDHASSVIQSYQDNTHKIAYVRDAFGAQIYAKSTGSPLTSRLGALSSRGLLRMTTAEEFYSGLLGILFVPSPPLFTSFGAAAFGLLADVRAITRNLLGGTVSEPVGCSVAIDRTLITDPFDLVVFRLPVIYGRRFLAGCACTDLSVYTDGNLKGNEMQFRAFEQVPGKGAKALGFRFKPDEPGATIGFNFEMYATVTGISSLCERRQEMKRTIYSLAKTLPSGEPAHVNKPAAEPATDKEPAHIGGDNDVRLAEDDPDNAFADYGAGYIAWRDSPGWPREDKPGIPNNFIEVATFRFYVLDSVGKDGSRNLNPDCVKEYHLEFGRDAAGKPDPAPRMYGNPFADKKPPTTAKGY